MRTMKALVYQRPGRANAAIRDVPYPVCGDTQLIIRVLSCGICKPAERSHDQGGSVLGRYPATPGHEFAGVVEEVGRRVTQFSPGDRVTADNAVPCQICDSCRRGQPAYCRNFGSLGHNLPGGMAQFVAVGEASAFHIPDGVSMNAACLSELVGCCWQCVERSGVRYGDDVLILGAGASGTLLTQLFRHSNAREVVAVDTVPSKLARAAASGAGTVLADPADPARHERMLLESHPLGFDRIVDTTGDAALMERSLELLKCGGAFVGYSFPTTARRRVSLDMGLFIRRELTYVGSTFQSYHFGRCLEAMAQGTVDAERIVTGEYPLDRYFEALDQNLRDPESVKIIIHPNGA